MKKRVLISVSSVLVVILVLLFALYSPRKVSSKLNKLSDVTKVEIVIGYDPEQKSYEFTGESIDSILDKLGDYKYTPHYPWDPSYKQVSSSTVSIYSEGYIYKLTSNSFYDAKKDKYYSFRNNNVERFDTFIAEILK